MKEVKIRLSSVQEAKEFVDLAGKCNFDIDLCTMRTVIDAKSLIGVLSIDLKNVLSICFNGENESFEEFLYKHEYKKISA